MSLRQLFILRNPRPENSELGRVYVSNAITMLESSTFTLPSIVSVEIAKKIRSQPECHLLWAVLEEALSTYMKYAAAKSRRGQRLFREAEQWIFQDDYTRLCSFSNICHILELHPQDVPIEQQHCSVSKPADQVADAASLYQR